MTIKEARVLFVLVSIGDVPPVHVALVPLSKVKDYPLDAMNEVILNYNECSEEVTDCIEELYLRLGLEENAESGAKALPDEEDGTQSFFPGVVADLKECLLCFDLSSPIIASKVVIVGWMV